MFSGFVSRLRIAAMLRLRSADGRSNSGNGGLCLDGMASTYWLQAGGGSGHERHRPGYGECIAKGMIPLTILRRAPWTAAAAADVSL